jgi:hypothetical protein
MTNFQILGVANNKNSIGEVNLVSKQTTSLISPSLVFLELSQRLTTLLVTNWKNQALYHK